MNRRSFITMPLAALVAALASRDSVAALIPPFFVNCVVALGFVGPGVENQIQVARMWHTIGTGFFYGKLLKDDPDITKRIYSVFLVTAKHVIDGYDVIQKEHPEYGNIKVRVNQLDQTARATEFDLFADLTDKGARWVNNPNGKDVVIIPINLPKLRDLKYDSMFFASDLNVAKIDKLNEIGTSAGDGVFVLGFPMDMAGKQKNYVIVRQGVIARISELLDRASDSLLLDAFVFPGNSGGPVILKPEIISINGTKVNASAMLIGLVNSSQEYTDFAISSQTKRPRIMFEENSGLTNVSPVDYIDDTISTIKQEPLP